MIVAIWFGVVAGMLAVYVALDGYDLGAGALHLFVARDDAERREVLGAIGPFWDGNEVWLVAGGGALVLAFPVAYAVGFSGFYLPLILVLWLLLLRGLSIELRNHVDNPLWAAFWDATFAVGSSLLAVVLGAALGNVLRGVPIGAAGYFSLPLFASFWPGPGSGVLDAYTVLVGVFTLVALSAHGGVFLAWRSDGVVGGRALAASRRLFAIGAVLLPVVSWATLAVRPSLGAHLLGSPLALFLLGLAVGAMVLLVVALTRGRARPAFLASTALLLTMLATAAAASWPVLLRSSVDPRFDLTAQAAASGSYALGTGLVWAAVGLPIACGYLVYVLRVFRKPEA